MASAIPIQMIDDDDDFDWEAAVREIDVACDEATKPPSSTATSFPFRDSNSHMGSCPNFGIDKPTTSRQSTLDRFIQSGDSRHEIQNARGNAQDEVELDDESISSVKIDTEAAKTWIYPENVPVREYQVSITRTALFSNTLVSLPTGLGKTLIAAVVMYNYFRWFPEGKIVFAAPSRPLVMQQIEACHNIVGIPQEWTIDMTGQTNPTKRACLWKTKRVFFVTPQVLEKDIQSGSCLVKQLVCLVIDEAHRASGNYSYCVAVRELMAVPVQLRILALTATPGSKQQTVQQIIDNLQISSLEYRNESDPDVTPYVHDRKLELIQVAMGQDAVEVDNLLVEVIRPFVARLSAIGVLPQRDFQTLSPCDFLNSRDKFRRAPPHDLPQLKYGEIEGFFGVLITLYHIRKLLSSHGIRPAFEMLEEKLKQGSFARFLGRNEALWRAKIIMQQSLSHGALSPKFSKMLEVLIEHFKNKDPLKSRVIIFSNFRGSVRDIMKALATIGASVRATEFIGQSSGKTSKGQSQKVQQAVLEKFRNGGYNVIVATSIGEEGLDIMEVDLVICFDANVSPLRMIQRMGRTGRKNEGRVVVLACEGSEVKGYMRKQANSKAIKKHMRNKGMNSFSFHSSPRMVPHVFRPEKLLVKLIIEEFVPRGKKVKDDDAIETPKYKAKLTDAETDLLAKYFHPSSTNNWRPSLIAFPHFQAFPSRVHEVGHSIRSGMLIDMMQCMQGLSFSEDSKAIFDKDVETSEECVRVESVAHRDRITTGDDPISQEPDGNILSPVHTSIAKEKHDSPDIRCPDPPFHSFLFGSDFVSIDPLGKVLVLSVPSLPLKQVSPSKDSSPRITVVLNCSTVDSSHLRASDGNHPNIESDVKSVTATPERCEGNNNLVTSCLQNFDDLQEERLAGDVQVFEREICGLNSPKREGNTREIPSAFVENEPLFLVDEESIDSKVADLSPRLTNLLKSGVVPESPIDTGTPSKGNDHCMSPDLSSHPNLHRVLLSTSLVPSKNDEGVKEATPSRGNVMEIRMEGEIQTPVTNLLNSSSKRCISTSEVAGEIRTPQTILSSDSCSKDWILSSGGKSESVGPKQKLKRLRKYGDIKIRCLEETEETVGHTAISRRSRVEINRASDKHGRGGEKLLNDARVFVEEEAEVSSEVAVSGDEEEENEQDSFDDSFIDDRINPTVASTLADATQCDMMAVYRRSLLSQSPIRRKSNSLVDFSPDYTVPTARMHDSGSTVGTTNPSLHTNGKSSSFSSGTERFSSDAILNTISGPSKVNESRKRKLSFSLPIRNLEKEILLESSEQNHITKMEDQNVDAFDDDDEFYEGIDFDALEEQAAQQLRSKSEQSKQNEKINVKPVNENFEFLGSPSFDLGI